MLNYYIIMVCMNYCSVLGYVFCGTWALCMWYMCILWGARVLRIPDIFCTAGFMLICDLVACVYHPLLFCCPVLNCHSVGFLKLLFTAICLILIDYSFGLYRRIIL
jgi:hypothetical protein